MASAETVSSVRTMDVVSLLLYACRGVPGRLVGDRATMRRIHRTLAVAAALAALVLGGYLWLPWPSDLIVTVAALIALAAFVVLELLLP